LLQSLAIETFVLYVVFKNQPLNMVHNQPSSESAKPETILSTTGTVETVYVLLCVLDFSSNVFVVSILMFFFDACNISKN